MKASTHFVHSAIKGNFLCIKLIRNWNMVNGTKEKENLSSSNILKYTYGASLVAQWLRICLLVRGTRVRALVWEDPTCHGAAGPVSHNY